MATYRYSNCGNPESVAHGNYWIEKRRVRVANSEYKPSTDKWYTTLSRLSKKQNTRTTNLNETN